MNRHYRIMNPLTVAALALGLCSLPVCGQKTSEPFNAGELNLSPFLTYVDKTGDKWGVGASVTYFLTKHLGVGGSTYWTDFKGRFFDNLYGEAYFRLPVGRRIAPYAVGSIGYVFESEERSATVGAGVDFRASKRLSAFGDIQWRYVRDTKDGAFLRLGARLTF